MLFFTLEYLVRFTVVPHKWAFVKQPLNIIDLFTIVPFLLEACLPLLGVYDVELRNFRGKSIMFGALDVYLAPTFPNLKTSFEWVSQF